MSVSAQETCRAGAKYSTIWIFRYSEFNFGIQILVLGYKKQQVGQVRVSLLENWRSHAQLFCAPQRLVLISVHKVASLQIGFDSGG